MLNRLSRKLRKLTSKISAYDLARVVQIVGALERDAFFTEKSRFNMHVVRVTTNLPGGGFLNESFEINFREFYDEKNSLQEEMLDLTVNGELFNLTKDSDAARDIPITQGIRRLLVDFLKNKELYVDIYQNLMQIAGIQSSLYEDECLREETKEAIIAQTLGDDRGHLFQ